MKRTRVQVGWLSIAGSCIAATSAHAQGPIVEPKLFGWGEPPSSDMNAPNTLWQGDRYFRRMTEVNLTWGGYTKSLTSGINTCVYWHYGFDAVAAARAMVRDAMLGTPQVAGAADTPPTPTCGEATQLPVASGDICLVLTGFGVESKAFDAGSGANPSVPTRYFREEDAIELILPGDLLVDTSEARTHKPYKHPLVINSRKVPSGNGFVTAPMRTWMIAFCAEYKAIQADPARAGLPAGTVVPNPSYLMLDSEPLTSVAPSINSVRMLRFLSQNWRWNSVVLPGDPLGRTAAADLEVSQEVDKSDLDLFVEAYLTGT